MENNENRLLTFKDFEVLKKEIISEVRKILKQKVEPKWIKSDQLKKLLNISHGTLQKMRNKNEITYSRVGRIIYYLESDIHKMMEERSNKK